MLKITCTPNCWFYIILRNYCKNVFIMIIDSDNPYSDPSLDYK